MPRTLVYPLMVAAVVLGGLAACGQATPGQSTTFGDAANTAHVGASAHAMPTAAASGVLVPVVATSELVVGPNRVALGLLEHNVPLEDAAQTSMTVRYFRLNGSASEPVGEPEAARYFGENLGPRGTWIVRPTFDRAGPWGLELAVTRPNAAPQTLRIAVKVAERATAPKIGDQAPRSDTPTSAEVTDLTTITSDAEPDARLYERSVADAVASGTPSLIMFATPGFCETAVCAPGVDVLGRLKDTFGTQINTVHVEIYNLPYEGTTVPAMAEWQLQSEPWLFLVNADGMIAGRYEGGITYQELEPDVAALVQP